MQIRPAKDGSGYERGRFQTVRAGRPAQPLKPRMELGPPARVPPRGCAGVGEGHAVVVFSQACGVEWLRAGTVREPGRGGRQVRSGDTMLFHFVAE